MSVRCFCEARARPTTFEITRVRVNRGLAAGGKLAARRAREETRLAAGDGARGGEERHLLQIAFTRISNARQLAKTACFQE